MAYDIPKFLKRKGDALLFANEGEFIFFVPEQYFTSKNAIVVGEYVNLLGILDYTIRDKSGKNGTLKPFKFPTVFLTKPGEMEKVKELKLTANSKVQDYRLLKYKKDDEVIVSVKVPQDIANVEDFYQQFLITGNIPTTIPYDKIHEYFTESISLNGSRYNVSLQLFGIVISEMCRSISDESKPFRLTGEKDMTKYNAISIKSVPKFISPYSAITSENWDEAVVNAIINKNVKNSPMEKILMN